MERKVMKSTVAVLTLLVASTAACTADRKVTSDSAAATGAAVNASTKTTPAKPALDAGETMQSVITGNVWVRIRGLGAGVPVVLIPGAPGTGSFALKGFEDIGIDRNVIRYDLLGTGRSDALPDTAMVSPTRAADDLESLRRALKVERWSVVGHSYGAAIAVAYAKARPYDVLGVVLINPHFTDGSDSAHTLAALQASAVSQSHAADLDSLRRMPGVHVNRSLQRTVGDTALGGMTVASAAAALRKGDVPTLIISGARDTSGTRTARELAKAVPRARLAVLPGVGAFAVMEAAEATRDSVRVFLQGIEPKVALPVKAGPRRSRG